MTDNNNVAMNAETPEAEIPVAPIPETEALAEQKEPKTGTITVTVTDEGAGHRVETNLDGTFNPPMFVSALACVVDGISKSSGIPAMAIFAEIIKVYDSNCTDEEEQDHEDKDV